MPELKVKIGGDGTGFARALDAAKARGSAFSKSIAAEARSVSGIIGGIFAGAGAALGAKALMDAAGRFKDMSDQTGISAEKLQAWALTAQQSGSTAESVAAAVSKMGVQISKAVQDPTGDIANAFAELGVSMQDLQTQPLETTFEQIAEHIRTATVDAKLLGNVVNVFGKSGASLIPTFKADLSQNRVYNSQADIEELDKFGDKLSKYTAYFKQAGTSLIAFFAGAFNKIEEKVMPKSFSELGGGGKKTLTPEEKRALALTPEETAAESAKAADQQEKAAAAAAKKSLDAEMAQRARVDAIEKQTADQRRRNALAGMSDEERRNVLLAERASLLADLDNPAAFSPETRAEKALRIEQLNGEIAAPPARPSTMAAIQADAASRIGAFIGGAGPGLTQELYGRQQLEQQRAINRNTAGTVAALQQILRTTGDDGF